MNKVYANKPKANLGFENLNTNLISTLGLNLKYYFWCAVFDFKLFAYNRI